MKDLANTQQQLENNILTSKIQITTASVALAFERTNLPMFNTDKLVLDVLKEFENTPIKDITKAIKKGSLGHYGRTYRMSTQEVCLWIREYKASTYTGNF